MDSSNIYLGVQPTFLPQKKKKRSTPLKIKKEKKGVLGVRILDIIKYSEKPIA
jgi:hypothetical protein